MNTLGLDIGTSGCKAVVFDSAGKQLALARREYAVVFTPDGGAELDTDAVIAACMEVIGESAAEAGGVEAIGVSSQGEAFTAIDGEGRTLNAAMVSSDARAVPQLTAFLEKFPADRLYEITGHTAHPMFTVFKLLWLRDAQPKVWESAAKFFCFEDMLAFRLGVEPAMGWPLAGRTMLFDVRRHGWSSEILSAIDLDDSRLARALPAGTVSGVIDGEICRKLHLRPGCRLVTGGHDQTCAALGAGVTKPGLAMYATGTVECICPAIEQAVFSDSLREANLCTYDFTLPELSTTVAFSLTGGNILQWFRDQFGTGEMAEAKRSGGNAYSILLDGMATRPSSLQVLPYFTPSGTPYFDSSTPGAILGLRLSTTRGEILRALLEGVAMEMRLNLEILEATGSPIRELRAVGGGSKSPVWNQLKADVLGRDLATIDGTEAGCRGAALLARTAVTEQSPGELAAQWIKILDVCHPSSANTAAYRDKFEKYRAIYPAISALRS